MASLLQRAEAQLAAGETASATDSFDRAALTRHAPEIEMGLVRAYLQAGEYRRALAFCAHAAGAHLESAAPGGLYAWLLRLGGQRSVADRVLGETQARWPDDPVTAAVRRAFTAGTPAANGLLLQTPHRMAPAATMMGGQAPVVVDATVVASGALIDGGSRVLVAASVLSGSAAQRLWVRNGIGQTSAASVDATPAVLAPSGLRVLRLAQALPAAGPSEAAPRAPFAGSPAFLVGYAEAADADPAWPALFPGFVGPFSGTAGLRRLSVDPRDGPNGGPVFDGAGRVIGMALRGADGSEQMVPAEWWTTTGEAAVAAPPATPMSAEQVYERALRLAVKSLRLRRNDHN